jgi:hypothetical protein
MRGGRGLRVGWRAWGVGGGSGTRRRRGCLRAERVWLAVVVATVWAVGVGGGGAALGGVWVGAAGWGELCLVGLVAGVGGSGAWGGVCVGGVGG